VYGLPSGSVYDLQGDPFDSAGNPGNLTRVYAVVDGAGVYRTDDLGDKWVSAGGATFGTAASLFMSHVASGAVNLTTVNARLAVRGDATGDTSTPGWPSTWTDAVPPAPTTPRSSGRRMQASTGARR